MKREREGAFSTCIRQVNLVKTEFIRWSQNLANFIGCQFGVNIIESTLSKLMKERISRKDGSLSIHGKPRLEVKEPPCAGERG